MPVYPGYQIQQDINDLQDEVQRIRDENSCCCLFAFTIFVVTIIAMFILG